MVLKSFMEEKYVLKVSLNFYINFCSWYNTRLFKEIS